MNWLDAILGKTKPLPSKLEPLFGMSTATITLQAEFDLQPTGGAAICFRPVSSAEFARLQRDIDGLLTISTRETALQWHGFTDPFGSQWMVLQTADVTDLVATVHMVSRELQDSGFGEQLLASVFQFRDLQRRSVYWLYNYKRGAFYPFVPSGDKQRDNAYELRLSAVLGKELKIDQDLTRWYALWGIPLDR